MSYAAMADAGIKAIMGISNGVLQEANVNAANKVNDANAYASNIMRAANNKLGAARGSLARYTQSVNNQRVMENAGSNLEAASINYRRARDSATQDGFEQQIAFAEQAGAQAAASALSGLTGGVADLVRGTTALRQSRLQQRVDAAEAQGDWDASQQAKHIMQSGWDSLDASEINDTIDYGQDVAVKQRYGGNLFTEAIGGQDLKSLANITSSFKFSTPSDPRAGIRGQKGYD